MGAPRGASVAARGAGIRETLLPKHTQPELLSSLYSLAINTGNGSPNSVLTKKLVNTPCFYFGICRPVPNKIGWLSFHLPS